MEKGLRSTELEPSSNFFTLTNGRNDIRKGETSKKGGFFLRDCSAPPGAPTNGLLNVRGFWSIKRKEGEEERGVLWPPEVVVELRTVAAN